MGSKGKYLKKEELTEYLNTVNGTGPLERNSEFQKRDVLA